MKILMVCMGNICRSPTLEGVLRHQLAAAGLLERVHLDSAGTHAYHVGEAPDARSQQHAARRGYDLSQQRARQVESSDFETFDLILAADTLNLAALSARCPKPHRHKLKLAMTYAPAYERDAVPDPYYGGAQGFETVLDYAEAIGEGLIKQLRERLNAG